MPGCSTLSVVMSVYNGERFLDEAVDSIRQQTFRDFEFVVVVNGCRDRSREILERHAAADDRLRLVIQEPLLNLDAALNRGIAAARADIVARMDADDVALPDRLRKQLAYLNDHPDIAVVGGAIEYIDDAGRPLGGPQLPTEPDVLSEAMIEQNYVAHAAAMFRRAAFEAVGGYRSAFRSAEDYDLWLRVIERFRIANLADLVLRHRLHTDKLSTRDCEQQALSAFAARYFARRRRARIDDPPELGTSLVTTDLLCAAGVTREEIRDLLYHTYYGQAYAALRVGDLASAVPLMERASQHTSADRARRDMAELRLALARAKPGALHPQRHRAIDWLRAFQLAPGRTLKQIFRELRH